MKRHISLKQLCATATVFLSIMPSWVLANTTNRPTDNPLEGSSASYADGTEERVIVRFKDGTATDRVSTILDQTGIESYRQLRLDNTYVVTVPQGETSEQLLGTFEACADVQYAENDGPVYAATTPNDPYYDEYQSTLFDDMAINESRTASSATTPVVVALLDTGADYEHPDLKGRLLQGYDFVNNDGLAQDDSGHGTFCAGIIAATTNNNVGIAGATNSNCMIRPVKVLDANGTGYDSDVANGIEYALESGTDIISLGFSGDVNSQTVQSAIDDAHNAGIVVLAAAGNSGEDVEYPAANSSVISVGAVDASMIKADYSCHGEALDLVAIGSDVTSTGWNANSSVYETRSGTSFACAYATALASMVLAGNPELTPNEVEQILEANTTDLGELGWDENYGYGCINFANTIKAASIKTDNGEKTSTEIILATKGANREFPLTVEPGEVTLNANRTVSLKASYNGTNVTSKCTWSSDAPSIAKVSQRGVVTSLKADDHPVLIKAEYNGATAYSTVKVTNTTNHIDLIYLEAIPSEVSVMVGETAKYQIKGHWSNNTTSDWTSLIPKTTNPIAKVVHGSIVGEKVGKSKYTFTYDTKHTAFILVTVTANPAMKDQIVDLDSNIKANSVKIKQGETTPINITATYGDNSSKDVTSKCTWSYSNDGVAKINRNLSGNYVISATSVGSTDITASINGSTATCKISVTVTDDSTSTTKPTLVASPSSLTLSKGQSSKVSITVKFSNRAPLVVTNVCKWSSANSKIASVSTNGTIKGIQKGTTTVKANYNGFTTGINVTVK